MTQPGIRRIGIVVGLVAEARCLEPVIRPLPEEERPLIFCSGGGGALSRDGVHHMVGQGIGGLLSFGVGGGLEPALKPGALILADAVIDPAGRRYRTETYWRERVARAAATTCPMRLADIAGSDAPLTSVAAKRALRQRSGAVIVDMESQVAAAAAEAAGLPFLAIRAVADPADRRLPEAALAGLTPDGRPRPLAVIARLLLRPWDIPAMSQLAGDMAAALRSLRGVAALGAGNLFGVDR